MEVKLLGGFQSSKGLEPLLRYHHLLLYLVVRWLLLALVFTPLVPDSKR